jgi:hypothetical protein
MCLAACLAQGDLGVSAAAPAPDDGCRSRECRYFRHYFDAANGPGNDAAFEAAHGAVRSEWDELHAVSPGVSALRPCMKATRDIHDDGDAIEAFGGGDAGDARPERQAAILQSWQKVH